MNESDAAALWQEYVKAVSAALDQVEASGRGEAHDRVDVPPAPDCMPPRTMVDDLRALNQRLGQVLPKAEERQRALASKVREASRARSGPLLQDRARHVGGALDVVG